jgi:hypothetical protein
LEYGVKLLAATNALAYTFALLAGKVKSFKGKARGSSCRIPVKIDKEANYSNYSEAVFLVVCNRSMNEL